MNEIVELANKPLAYGGIRKREINDATREEILPRCSLTTMLAILTMTFDSIVRLLSTLGSG